MYFHDPGNTYQKHIQSGVDDTFPEDFLDDSPCSCGGDSENYYQVSDSEETVKKIFRFRMKMFAMAVKSIESTSMCFQSENHQKEKGNHWKKSIDKKHWTREVSGVGRFDTRRLETETFRH